MRLKVDVAKSAAPEYFDLTKMVGEIEKIDVVKDVHHSHVWVLTTEKNIVSMHVLVDEVTDQRKLPKEIHHLLKEEFSVYFSTVQIETECPERDEVSDININMHSSVSHKSL